MKVKSKFYGIKFPIFCLKKHPTNLKLKQGYLVDDKNQVYDSFNYKTAYESYLERLLKLEIDTSIIYDYTANNLTELLTVIKSVKFGIDISSKLYDFRKTQVFEACCKKPVDIKSNIFRISGIPYPFTCDEKILDKNKLKDLWIDLINVDNVWYIYKFQEFNTNIKKIRI